MDTTTMIKIRCKYCKYKWGTKSGMDFVCCPKCLRKNTITRIIDVNEFIDKIIGGD